MGKDLAEEYINYNTWYFPNIQHLSVSRRIRHFNIYKSKLQL